jgi:DnaJ-class molecular chaperone
MAKDTVVCQNCGGTGRQGGPGTGHVIYYPCPYCNGTGEVAKDLLGYFLDAVQRKIFGEKEE